MKPRVLTVTGENLELKSLEIGDVKIAIGAERSGI